MNTSGEDAAAVGALIDPSSELSGDGGLSLPSDLTVFVVASMCVLSVAFISAFEGLKVDFNRTGKEFQSGHHQRNVFYFSLMVASSFKFVMMMMEVRYFTNETCASSHVCSFLRFAPDLLFLAAYSVMIMFLTQLGYDVAGVPSVAPKKTFLTCSFVCVALFFPCMIFEPNDDPNLYLFRFLGVVHLLLFCIIIYSGITVSRHIPSGITIGQRILSRLIALCVVCGYSTLLGAGLYLVAMKAVWTLGYPKERLLLFDGVVVLFKDVLPMVLILYFTTRRASSSASSVPPSSRTRTAGGGGGTRVSSTSSLLNSKQGGGAAGSSRHSYTRIEDTEMMENSAA